MKCKAKLKSSYNKKRLGDKRKKSLVLLTRWVMVLFVVPLIHYNSGEIIHRIPFLETLGIAFIYNFLLTMIILKRNGRNDTLSYGITYVDVILVAIFSFQSGGINSDIFLILFLSIAYCAIYDSTTKIFKISTFAILTYSFSCILFARIQGIELSLGRLAVRVIFLFLAAVGVSLINLEVKRFNELHKKEFKLARTDKLTGLANRHYFDQKLNEEVQYADSVGTPLNVMIFDLDNFKKFNDTYGHIWGDKLLTLFSDIIKQNIRVSDIPVRYGGEEFLILIRDLDPEMARCVGERIRRQLEKQKIYVDNLEARRKVTVSCGIAQYPLHSSDIKEVIELADKALYRAKETGKNTVVVYGEKERNCAQ